MKVISIHNFISSSGSGTVINYGSGSDFLSYGSGSTSQKVTVPTVPVPQQFNSESTYQRVMIYRDQPVELTDKERKERNHKNA